MDEFRPIIACIGAVLLLALACWIIGSLLQPRHPLGAGRRRNDEIATSTGYSGGEGWTIEPTVFEIQQNLQDSIAQADEKLTAMDGHAVNGIYPAQVKQDIKALEIRLSQSQARYGVIEPKDYSKL